MGGTDLIHYTDPRIEPLAQYLYEDEQRRGWHKDVGWDEAKRIGGESGGSHGACRSKAVKILDFLARL